MTNSSSHAVWSDFFISAGIPNAVANEYAVTFSQHRIRIDMLKEITKDILLDMGIKAMGDIIAILRHAKHVCIQNELKVGQAKLSTETHSNTMGNVANNNLARQPQQNSRNRSHQPVVQNSSSGHLNDDEFTSSNSGGKIQSRLSLSSGALRAATNNSSSHLAGDSHATAIQKRLSSPTPVPIAKRLRPGSSGADTLDVGEKTLTVHYPPKSAIIKAQQRISGNAATNNNNGQSTSNIKSRLGGKAGDITRSGYDAQGRSRTNNSTTAAINSRNLTQQHRSNKQDSRGRHDDSVRFNHKSNTNSNAKQQTNRPKSTVFRRLGEGAR